MKKITSLMMMMVLCCIGAFAQATDLEGKIVRIGACQGEMVPGKWYFLHNPRNPDTSADAFTMPDGDIQSAGGLVADQGAGSGLKLTATTDIDQLTAEEGVSANEHMNKFVRFVAVEGVEGAYNIQFGNGNWVAHSDGGQGTNVPTVTNNQYIAGQAGQYNFYLVNINGAPNQAGRFGWNKHNMANRFDNNGAGGTVVFWGEGLREAGEKELDPADGSSIKGNHIWQIFDIEVLAEEDPYESAFDALISTMSGIQAREDGNYIDNLKKGENVGNSYGNYRPENVAAFLEIHSKLEELVLAVDANDGNLDVMKEEYPTAEDLKAEHERYQAADQKVTSDKVPLAVADIAPGYYTINSAMDWYVTKGDTIYYTQAEADEINTENGYVPGDEGYVTTDSVKEVQSYNVVAPIKALLSKDDNGTLKLAWGTRKENSDFLWKIEKAEGSETKYRLINMGSNTTFNGVAQSAQVQMVVNDTATVLFDYRGKQATSVPGTKVSDNVKGEEVTVYNIRNSHEGSETGYTYLHCGNHGGGAGTGSFIVGWSDGGATRWYLSSVDEETAEEWINGGDAKVRKMVTEANNIVNAVPAQIEVAKDSLTTIFENDSVIVDATQITANSTTLDAREGITIEDTYAYLLDGNPATFWHSQWENGNVAARTHYLQIVANEPLEGKFTVKLARRKGAANDHPVKLAVVGYDANDSELGFDDGENLGSLTFPFDGDGTWATANNLFDGKGHTVYRFYWEDSNGGTDRGYWHCSAFNIFKADKSTVHEKTQYQVRETIINRLQAAMDAWNAGEYSAEDGELLNNDAFNAAYNELIAASEAWKAVYVNPTALREAIAAAPAEKLFVTGNNPGQWKEGSVTPGATVNEAKAYDEACAYTPAESERLIKAIADVTAEAYANANKVQTGKWYRIKFPTEEMYDTYEWSKTGANNVMNNNAGEEVSPALFGKTVAAGKGKTEYVTYANAEDATVIDTLATYKVEAAEESFNGQNLYFFNEEQIADINDGDDLFRFIQATDTSYIIQNKSTGLFLRGGQPVTLSDVPTYYSTKALGAGANLVTYTNVLGEKAQHCNLHGERSTNRLVCWEAAGIGSNSALLIEEVEDVTEEPATAYSTKLWPGSVYAYTKPVDVTIAADVEAVAYGAELVIGNADGDTAIVLKKIEAETIKAGTPFILIANETHDEYITPADRLAQIAAEVTADEGKYGYYEKQIAAELRDGEYVAIEMDHGMAVDTLQKGNGDLVGTFRSLTVAAGKGIVTKDNGFAHTLINTTVGANGAYIKCDFDPESTDVLGTIKVDINGSITDGITDALDKVAKSGNIYTVDGKLVGKGNINAINNLPAGIYIVNGVKVTKN